MAQGFACKDSATAANVSPETIRARRKRIYRKLDLAGVADLMAGLLAVSLDMLVRRERLEPRTSAADAAVPALASMPMDRGGAAPGRLGGASQDVQT
jgi:DNA-binding NarL/FixJ family response regulator